MLARGSEEYALKVIDPAVAPKSLSPPSCLCGWQRELHWEWCFRPSQLFSVLGVSTTVENYTSKRRASTFSIERIKKSLGNRCLTNETTEEAGGREPSAS